MRPPRDRAKRAYTKGRLLRAAEPGSRHELRQHRWPGGGQRVDDVEVPGTGQVGDLIVPPVVSSRSGRRQGRENTSAGGITTAW